MADSSATTPAAAADQLANLHLDEVTGERVSKSELKKRQKQRQKEAEKAAKAATAPPKATSSKPKNAAGGEEDLNPNQYYEIRTRQVNELLKNPETNPYPHKFQVNYDDSNFVEEFGSLKTGETLPEKELRIAGRIYNIRTAGSKLIFYGTISCLSKPDKNNALTSV